jgi:hypothetical protein
VSGAAADACAGADGGRLPAEREKGAHAEAEFLRSIRAAQVMMVPLTAADLDGMAVLVETYGDPRWAWSTRR